MIDYRLQGWPCHRTLELEVDGQAERLLCTRPAHHVLLGNLCCDPHHPSVRWLQQLQSDGTETLTLRTVAT